MPAADVRQTLLISVFGIHPDLTVDVLDLDDPAILEALKAGGANLSLRPRFGTHLVLLGAEDPQDLAALRTLEKTLHPKGRLWVVLSQENSGIAESDIRTMAQQTGFAVRERTSIPPARPAFGLVRSEEAA